MRSSCVLCDVDVDKDSNALIEGDKLSDIHTRFFSLLTEWSVNIVENVYFGFFCLCR